MSGDCKVRLGSMEYQHKGKKISFQWDLVNKKRRDNSIGGGVDI